MHRWKPRFERLLILLEVARGKLYETGSLDSGKKGTDQDLYLFDPDFGCGGA